MVDLERVAQNLADYARQEREFVTDWLTITQAETTAFARITRDQDPMHDDPEWARANSPYGGTIAFGFHVLAFLTYFNYQALPRPEGIAFALNYGLERVRFIEPVLVGSRLRNRLKITDVAQTDKGLRVGTDNTIELEGAERPACTAQWIGLMIPEDAH